MRLLLGVAMALEFGVLLLVTEVLVLLVDAASGVDSMLEMALKELAAREVLLKRALTSRAVLCMAPLELVTVVRCEELVELLLVALTMVET